MKRQRQNLILAFVTLLSGLLAVVLAYSYLQRRLDEQRVTLAAAPVAVVEQPQLRNVVVIQRDVFRGERIGAEDLTLLRVPIEGVTVKGVVTDPATAIGRVALQPLYAGEWLIERKLSDASGGAAGWGGTLEAGQRAMRVPVDATSGLLGILEPGDRVDVISVFASSDGHRMIGRTVEQNLAVLAVGQRRTPSQGDEGATARQQEAELRDANVTLEVDQRQAEVLALAMQVGKVRLVLRNGADTDMPATTGVNVQYIETAPPTDESRLARYRHVIEVVKGDQVEKEVVKP